MKPNHIKNPDTENFTRIHNLGMAMIESHNKYEDYTPTQIWAVGLGGMIGNYDISDYDPSKYSSIEFVVMALKNNFKDIGGPGVGAIEYINLIRKYYSEDAPSVLRLSLASSMDDNPLSPVIISDTYHPKLLRLYVKAANEGVGRECIYTNEELEILKDRIDDAVSILIFSIVGEQLYR